MNDGMQQQKQEDHQEERNTSVKQWRAYYPGLLLLYELAIALGLFDW
jgi:hypothetical protein